MKSKMGERPANPGDVLSPAVLESLPFGILVVGAEGDIVAANAAACEWLLIAPVHRAHCCDVLGCGDPDGPLGGQCLAAVARSAGEPLPEIRIDLTAGGDERAVWATAAPVRGEESEVVIHLRPGDPRDRRRRTNPHWLKGPELTIRVLGRTEIESPEGSIGGEWLDQRPGQILKYLISRRGEIAHTEAIAESIWPGADARIAGSVRHFIHALRDVLEPDRPKRRPSSFVVFERGGYRLDRQRVKLDVDEFERCAGEGVQAARADSPERARRLLERVNQLYRGDFLSDEPYADWVLAERERLRSIATHAMQALAELRLDGGDEDGATALLIRLAEMQPFDTETQRTLIEALLQRGLRSEAKRRYAAMRARLLRDFGEEPDFTLSDLGRAAP